MSNLDEALSYIKGTVPATSITKVDRLTCAVCGKKKTGKSLMIAKSCRKPSMHYDFDNRRESIAGSKDVTIKTIYDIATGEPKTYAELENDIGTFEYLKQQNKLPWKSIILDSMTFLRQFAENQMMKDTKLERKWKIGTVDYHIAQGWDAVTNVQKMLQQVIRRIQALDVDLYCVFHTQNEKDKVRSTKDNAVYTEKIVVEPQNLEILLTMFNEVWQTKIDESNKFVLQTRPDYYFQASTALNIDATEEQDIQKLLDKHLSKQT